MGIPDLQPLDPAEVRERALAVLRADRICFLATADGGQPRLRPISPVKRLDFTVYVVNLRSYNKTREIAENPKVELCYVDARDDQVRITGVAEVVNDPILLQEILGERTLLRAYMDATDASRFVLYCVRPTSVRYMQGWAAAYHEVPLD
jgi:uncharacterized pyridoxamine 5'-phosphate oxidase family protein